MTYRTDGSTVEIAELDDVAGVGGAAQQLVELVELAALPLPAHPAPFAGVPAALAVEQEEAIGAVARVQALDAGLARRRAAPRLRGASRSAASRKSVSSAKCRCVVAVGEEPHLEIVDQRLRRAPRCR